MTEIRCVKCKRRLFDVTDDAVVIGVQIKCPKCGYVQNVLIAERWNRLLESKQNVNYGQNN